MVTLLMCMSVCYVFQSAHAAADTYDRNSVLKRDGDIWYVDQSAHEPLGRHDRNYALQGTGDATEKAIADMSYEELESAKSEIGHKIRKLEILAQIKKDNVWDDFKLVYWDMERAATQSLQEEKLKQLKRKSRKRKIKRSRIGCG